jgi:hypothetical protein
LLEVEEEVHKEEVVVLVDIVLLYLEKVLGEERRQNLLLQCLRQEFIQLQ